MKPDNNYELEDYAKKYYKSHKDKTGDINAYLDDVPFLFMIDSALKNYSLLYLGAGIGGQTRYLKNYGELVCLDKSEKMVEYSKKFFAEERMNRVSVICSEFMGFQPTKKFDVVVAVGLIEVYSTWNQAAVDKIVSLLNPNGYAILSTRTHGIRSFLNSRKAEKLFNDNFNIIVSLGLKSVKIYLCQVKNK